jgi:hypothetical protein
MDMSIKSIKEVERELIQALKNLRKKIEILKIEKFDLLNEIDDLKKTEEKKVKNLEKEITSLKEELESLKNLLKDTNKI